MRSLLLNITPLQLEALVHEIFSNNPSAGSYLSVYSASDNSRTIPPEWKGIRKKSKRFHFRKDAYLGEMSFQELQNFAQSIELWSIADNEQCNDFEDAMDIFAIEFEMLVSGYQRNDASMNSGSHQQKQVDDDLQSYMSSNSLEEGENLRRSLRACSVPELRLVAERLNLDHSECGNSKADLIMLIEHSMPDMLNSSGRSGNSRESIRSNPPPPPPRDGGNAAMYVEESHARQQQQEPDEHDRSRRVKFSTDCKQDTSHLIPKREVNTAVWGNYVVDGNDIESNDDSQPLMYDDNGGYDPNGEPQQNKDKRSLKWPQQRKRFIIVGAFVSVIVGVALGLGLGLTKDLREGGGSQSATTNIMTGPWNIGFGSSFESSDQPSISPSEIPPPKNVVVVLNSTKKTDAPAKKPTKGPTSKPSAVQTSAPTAQTSLEPNHGMDDSYDSGGISSIEVLTNSPTLSSQFVDNDGEDFSVATPTANPTISPVMSIVTKEPTGAPISSPPTAPPTITSSEQLHPRLGPFDEAGMRMILYGITELSSMGKTQWKMLTSAFVEQFYNHGEKGDGK
jgi:hypothetical protein